MENFPMSLKALKTNKKQKFNFRDDCLEKRGKKSRFFHRIGQKLKQKLTKKKLFWIVFSQLNSIVSIKLS